MGICKCLGTENLRNEEKGGLHRWWVFGSGEGAWVGETIVEVQIRLESALPIAGNMFQNMLCVLKNISY
jgi:hypothetical protein